MHLKNLGIHHHPAIAGKSLALTRDDNLCVRNLRGDEWLGANQKFQSFVFPDAAKKKHGRRMVVVWLALDQRVTQAYMRDYMDRFIRDAAAASELLLHEIRMHNDLIGATLAEIENPLRSLAGRFVSGMAAAVVDRQHKA